LAFGSTTGRFIVSGEGVQLIVIVTVELTTPETIAAVTVPAKAKVVELYVTGRAVAPNVAVQLELKPLVELANEIGAATFW